MYITTMPVILAGISNMIIVKQKWFKKYAKPIDGGSTWKDNKRIFGNNKTLLGIFTMIICSIITHVIWGIICGNIDYLQSINELYLYNENTLSYNIMIGALMGVTYMIFELPNSFIKRRIDIPDGKTVQGIKGITFFIIDQLDSMIGIMLVLVIFSRLNLAQYINYVILGGITHIIVNLILYRLKIRRNV